MRTKLDWRKIGWRECHIFWSPETCTVLPETVMCKFKHFTTVIFTTNFCIAARGLEIEFVSPTCRSQPREQLFLRRIFPHKNAGECRYTKGFELFWNSVHVHPRKSQRLSFTKRVSFRLLEVFWDSEIHSIPSSRPNTNRVQRVTTRKKGMSPVNFPQPILQWSKQQRCNGHAHEMF